MYAFVVRFLSIFQEFFLLCVDSSENSQQSILLPRKRRYIQGRCHSDPPWSSPRPSAITLWELGREGSVYRSRQKLQEGSPGFCHLKWLCGFGLLVSDSCVLSGQIRFSGRATSVLGLVYFIKNCINQRSHFSSPVHSGFHLIPQIL